MKLKIGFYTLLAALSIVAGGCRSTGATVEQVNSGDRTVAAETEKSRNEETTANEKSFAVSSAVTFAGNYELKTYKEGGEGLINALEIKAHKGGKLSVSVAASFVYQANGAETFHETAGGGELDLKGNTASGELTEEGSADGKRCRLTVVFGANQATVKTAEDCYFGVSLDGVYRRKEAQTSPKSAVQKQKLREIQFRDAARIAEDHERYKTGERFVMTNVPMQEIARIERADSNGNKSYQGLYTLQQPEDADNTGGVGSDFFTSEKLVNQFATNPEYEMEAKSLRVTAILIQSDGEFDVFRTWFAVKLEGLNETGETIWTIEGSEPKRIKLRH